MGRECRDGWGHECGCMIALRPEGTEGQHQLQKPRQRPVQPIECGSPATLRLLAALSSTDAGSRASPPTAAGAWGAAALCCPAAPSTWAAPGSRQRVPLHPLLASAPPSHASLAIPEHHFAAPVPAARPLARPPLTFEPRREAHGRGGVARCLPPLQVDVVQAALGGLQGQRRREGAQGVAATLELAHLRAPAGQGCTAECFQHSAGCSKLGTASGPAEQGGWPLQAGCSVPVPRRG